jgi:hypothetical protein
LVVSEGAQTMRKSICALALIVTSIGIGAPAAYADSAGCVSKAEYRHVHGGMQMWRVHRIFDTRGHHVVGRVVEVRSYRGCPRHSAVSITYRHRRVSAKAAVWGR